MRMCEFKKLMVMGVLVVALTLGVQAASPKDAAAVKDVSLNSVGRALEARITTTESAKFTYFELEGPHRLVVDFHGLKNGIGFSQKSIQAAGVERVRTSYFKTADRTATRIVFDIDKSVNYRVIDDGEVGAGIDGDLVPGAAEELERSFLKAALGYPQLQLHVWFSCSASL